MCRGQGRYRTVREGRGRELCVGVLKAGLGRGGELCVGVLEAGLASALVLDMGLTFFMLDLADVSLKVNQGCNRRRNSLD